MRRDGWLGDLAEAWGGGDDASDVFMRELYWVLKEELLAGGMNGIVASRCALRASRAAALLLFGRVEELRQAAQLLAVSERTAKSDAARVRDVIPKLQRDRRRLRRVPVRDRDRIVVELPPRRRRRR